MSWPAGAEHDAPPERAMRLLADALRRPGARATLEVTGSCMVPLLRCGDLVTLTGAALPPPSGALIVAFAAGGVPVCHRVVGGDGNGAVLLAGDRSLAAESHESASILGQVLEARRGGRTLVLGELPSALDRLVALLHRAAAARLQSGHPLGRRLAGVLLRFKRMAAAARALSWRGPHRTRAASSGGTSSRSGPATRR